MDDISSRIYDYYIKHFDELPLSKQFHFASRLYLWSQDPEAKKLLDRLKPQITDNGNLAGGIRRILARTDGAANYETKNGAAKLREPYFDKYSEIRQYLPVIFRIMILRTIYSISAAQLFEQFFVRNEVEDFYSRLINDQEAIAYISAQAVNFFYLYCFEIKKEKEFKNVDKLFKVSQTVLTQTDPDHLKLLIYMYTHCIICSSQYYFKPVADTDGYYHKMIKVLDKLIKGNFKNVSLDNKIEFLVAAKLLGYSASSKEAILAEANKSMSDQGDFLVDKYNYRASKSKTDPAGSEHRNVLFILLDRPFKNLSG